jgi:hypothetical protein
VNTRRPKHTKVANRTADRQSKVASYTAGRQNKVANRTADRQSKVASYTGRQNKVANRTADRQSKYAAPADEFEIYPGNPEIQYIDSIERREKAETRAFIVKVLITFLLASVVAAGVYGLWNDRIEVVAATWATVFAALTPIINFYLERKQKQN